MKKLFFLLLLTATTASAGMLDILQYGVKDNPDRYVSFDLLATWNQQQGLTTYSSIPDSQNSLYNDRGMRGALRFPLTSDTTLLVGGNWYTGEFTYNQGAILPAYNGVAQGFGFEAGLRFYIHN